MLIRGYRFVSIALLPSRCRIGTPAKTRTAPAAFATLHQTVAPPRLGHKSAVRRCDGPSPNRLVAVAKAKRRGMTRACASCGRGGAPARQSRGAKLIRRPGRARLGLSFGRPGDPAHPDRLEAALRCGARGGLCFNETCSAQ